MRQWEIYDWEFPHGKHPCVVISNEFLSENADVPTVNVIGCSSHRAAREPAAHEFLLDAADGLDWETLARVDRIWLAKKTELKTRRGTISTARRKELGRKIIRAFGLWMD